MTDSVDLMREALALHHAGRLREAQLIYSRVLAADPENAEALHLSGLVAFREARMDDAIALLRRAVARAPNNALYLGNLGNVLKDCGRGSEAIESYQRALALDSDQTSARNNLGLMHLQYGTIEDAIRQFRELVARRPDHFRAHCNLAAALARTGNADAAERAYRRALALNPDFVDALVQLASLLQTQDRHDDAIAVLRRRAAVDPHSAHAHAELAAALERCGELDEALACYQNALALEPDALQVLCSFCALLQKTCDWERLALHARGIVQAVARGDAGVPAALLASLHDVTPAVQLQAARANAMTPGPRTAVSSHRIDGTASRLRIGYLSRGSNDATAPYRATQLLSLHDRAQCEVFLFAYASGDDTSVPVDLRESADFFFDVTALTDEACARQITQCRIDILVDFSNDGDGERIGVAAFRPAPIHVNAPGFRGTRGADWYDYMIADCIVAPQGAEPAFAEEIVRLPDCYRCVDRGAPQFMSSARRASYGLPADAIVLCCFSDVFRITAAMFALWLRVLAAVPQSTLWLAEDNTLASSSLRRRATGHGIDAARIVFAPRVSESDHLERYRTADLAIDTFPCAAAHAAQQALTMGCPVVTLAGDTFASRVTASMLAGAGLSELITHAPLQYERLITEVARDFERREALRATLADAREKAPLFDAPRYVRNLERAYLQMAANAAAGAPPSGFDLR